MQRASLETSRHSRTPAVVLAALLVGAGYSYLAAGTKPFTDGADVMTAIAFAVLCAVMVATLRRRHRQGVRRLPVHIAPGGRLLPWVVALGALVAWELVTYFAGISAGRHAFPTISSLADDAFRWRGAKAALFGGWLVLGWGLVRR